MVAAEVALVEGMAVALVEGALAALVTPAWLARPCPTSINLQAIDLPSGIGIEADLAEIYLTEIGIDLAVTGSLETGLPFLAWASLTTIITGTATPAYGRDGDGAGDTLATERER
jgi:hypothetical protein